MRDNEDDNVYCGGRKKGKERQAEGDGGKSSSSAAPDDSECIS